MINLTEEDFIGINYFKKEHDECIFCGKYFIKDILFEKACPHCWGFCFSSQIDLEKFTYNGTIPSDNLKNFIKKTWLIHPKTCLNNECVYFKINKLFNENKLNNKIKELLELIEVDKQEKSKSYNLNYKKRDVSINYTTSSISVIVI